MAMAIAKALALAAVALSLGCSRAASPPPPAHRIDDAEKLEAAPLGSITRVHELGGVYLASQPKADDFKEAARKGVKTVINLRGPGEKLDFDEKAAVEAAGMTYANVPFANAGEMTDSVLDDLRARLKSADRPILLHCASANRVGAVWLVHRVLDAQLTYDQAAAEAQAVGLKSPELDARARDYIKNRH